MKSKSVSVNVTANGLAANQAQQAANQAVTVANKYKMAWDEANSETIEALNTAQKEFESNLSWVKSQIYEGQHQNDSAVASLRSDMESSWNSMSTVEESLYNSAITATSEVDSHLESLRVQNSLSLADLHSTANSLHAVDESLHSNMDTIRGSLNDTRNSLATTTNDLANVKTSLVDTKTSLATATSEIANDLNNAKNSLAAVDNDLRNGVKQASNDLSVAKTSLEATRNSLATTTSELQRQTGQLSGSLSTANSMIMFNSDAIAEVKHTAEEISTTVVGGGNNLLNDSSDTLKTFTGQAWMWESSKSDIIPTHSIDGETVTLSAWIENPSKEAWVQMYTDKGRFLGNKIPAGGSGWSQVTYTMPSGWSVWNVVVGCGDSSGTITLSYKDVKLELGPNRTAWKPSNGDIAQLKVTADAIKADLTNTKGDVASVKATANSLQSQITDNKNNISSVKQTADSLTTRMSNAEGNVSSLQQTTSGLTTRVSNTEGNVSGLQQTATKLQSDLTNAKGDISSLQQTANGLTSRVGNAEGNISQLQQTANGLTSTVSNLHAGDRNYARNTSNEWQTLTGFTGATNYCTPDFGVFYPDDLQIGDTVTIGYTIKNSGIQSGKFQLQGPGNVTVWNAGSIGSPSYDISKVCPDGATTTLVQYLTLTADNLKNSKFNLRIRTDNFPAGTLSYKGLFVKKGNLATDWSPAPEDVDDSISQIKQTADQIQAQVTNAQGDISSVTQTANAVKTDLVNTKGDVAAVKATADSLTAQMADANGNISQLQQTAKGLQSTVTDQSDKISQLQQDADGLSATVGGAAIDLIPNLDQPFVMGYGIANTTWQDSNSYIQLPTTKIHPEVLPQTAGFTLNIPWQAGKTYMQSIIFETDAKVTDGMKWTWFAGGSHRVENATLVKLGNNTYRLIGSYTPTASEATHLLRMFDIFNFTDVVDVTTGTYLKFRNPRIWCPDDNSLAQLKLTADGLTSKVADTQGNVSKLEQTASDLQTQITNTKDDVASVKVTADSVRTDLTNANHDIASVKAKADSLTSSMANANNQISTLQQRADSITSTLSNGGVNLLSGTSDFSWPLAWWAGSGSSSINQSDTYNDSEKVTEHKCVMKPEEWQGIWWGGNNTVGQTYTLSFDARCDNGKAKICVMGLEGNFLTDAPLTTEWVRYHVSGKVTSGGHNWVTYFSTTESDNVYTRKYQIEYGETATPWKPSNGDITSLQQTASGLTADMKDAKGNISSLQVTASQFTTRLHDAENNVSSLQLTSKELDTQIKAVDGRATSIKETADGISARVSRIEGNNVVGSLLKLDGSEAGLGTYVNNKLIAGINTNPDGVCIEGKNIHLNGQTHIDDGVINASKITVHNSVGNADGSASDQNLAIAWGQLNSTIGGKDDQGNTLWGSINQTNSKLTSYYQELKNDGSSTRSLIQQTSKDILLAVDQKVKYKTYTVSASSPWDFNYTKSTYENWFINGDTSGNYFYNGPDGLKPWVYVQSRGSADGTRFVVTVWRDYDPTQYQRTWTGDHWTPWVMLPNSSNLISAINLSPDGVTIDGKNIELNGNTTIRGQLNLLPTDQRYVDQRVQGFHNPWAWRDANVFAGSGGLQLQSTIVSQSYSNDNTSISGLRGDSSAAITTLAPTYLKFTVYPSWNDVNNGFTNQLARTYIDAGRIETNDVQAGNFRLTGSKMRGLNDSLYVTNWNGTNFDNAGSVGFQVWSGIGLGRNTIYMPSGDLYIQQGNVGPLLGQRYSDAGKVNVHCNSVISRRANTVSSRLSVKTAITKVTYDRALMAVQNTDMYDYRYTSDETGQHYVSGIIDDIHDKPEYNMDPMLINKERTARIDANLLGYHQVVLQEILKRLDKLEAK
ncbi:gp58-like family protein [Lactobacillus delbrueckii subsp. lactis]|uniref:gp58-like family protein n=1 Tax=Lactobacillus delbrueckii TaxID=1584 RepID=UPI0022A66E1A|nr:gp58-like family protein [Lactobacillus delbrueckii]MCZ0795612.1 gp58-like family protein [Lactobacillus delbrueckii subsp. lactis]